jgi:hypothetical protein
LIHPSNSHFPPVDALVPASAGPFAGHSSRSAHVKVG